jgi:hypothetical protein
VAWGAGACELSIRWLGGCHLMLTQVYTSPTRVSGNPEKPGDFTKQFLQKPISRSFHAQIRRSGGRQVDVPVVTHDTRAVVKTSKFASASTRLLSELGDQASHREITDMTRNTKMKLAALATTLVATIGMVAAAPATGADIGGKPSLIKSDHLCC